MTDLNELLKGWKSKRLAYNEISRNSLEALFTGIVDDLDMVKRAVDGIAEQHRDLRAAVAEAKRGPGRPPKAEAA